MRIPEYLLSTVIAAMTAFCLLPCHDNCLAGGGSDGPITAGRFGDSDHPELSLSTNLWRSAFLDMAETNAVPDPPGPNDSGHPNGLPSAAGHVKLELAAVRLDHEFMDCALLSPEPASDLTLTDPVAGETLSDWEQAACLAAGSQPGGSERQGPSVISVIVGVVGLAIVVGAYFKSTR